MAGVKSLDKIVEKWNRVASGAQAEYEAGVRDPRKDWASATKAAEKAYDAGVQAAISAKRFGKGVSKAGTAKWQSMAIAKGPRRWSEGISLAKETYAAAFAPYHTALSSIVYPEKGPRGDPRNIDRVAKVASTLHALKIKIKGGG